MTLKKLKDNTRGASIVFALVAFLVATLVGITIVNAALLNVRRSASEENEEAAYLAVTSAACVIRECIGDLAYKQMDDSEEDEEKKYVIIGATEQNENISKVILEMAKSVSGSASGEVEKTIKIEDQETGDKGVPKVEGKITMDSNYNMKVVLKSKSKEKAELCEMVVGIRGSHFDKDDFPEDVYDSSVSDDSTTPSPEVKLVVQWPKDGIYIISTKVKVESNGP